MAILSFRRCFQFLSASTRSVGRHQSLARCKNDSKTEIRRIPLVLSQEGCQNRPPAQPRHVRLKEGCASSRAGGPIFQAPLEPDNDANCRHLARSNNNNDTVITVVQANVAWSGLHQLEALRENCAPRRQARISQPSRLGFLSHLLILWLNSPCS